MRASDIKFKTFQQRLLFWFLVFIGTNSIIIGLSLAYLNQREAIFHTSEQLESAYILLLKSVRAQQNFFSVDTKNEHYFQSDSSAYLRDYREYLDSTKILIQWLADDPNIQRFESTENIRKLQLDIAHSDSLFGYLVEKIRIRGFKDYNLEGEMRDFAHLLEKGNHISDRQVLSLRRHEKDFIIRNDEQYVQLFNERIREILRDPNLDSTAQANIRGYRDKFNALVAIDAEIGIKDNTGLKARLDTDIHLLEGDFNHTLNQVNIRKVALFNRLNWLFGGLALVLLLLSIYLSYLIARRITRPLKELTSHITRFVDSNFTLETDHPMVQSKDEIGRLTENFSILKDEVITRLKFFKQKVDERTQELADANRQLVELNKANARFVPQEFLHFLGKKNIQEVNLGDQVEKKMTIMFTDIRFFTEISESLSPQENFDFINSYLKRFVPVIRESKGFIDKYIGDSVMALFPKKVDHALDTIIDFRKELNELNAYLAERKYQTIEIGTGIHTGEMILGTIGHDDRLETTVISDAVNIASRMEGLTKQYGVQVIVTEESIEALKNRDKYAFRFLDQVRVKGKRKTLSVYEFVLPDEQEKLNHLNDYHAAWKFIEAGKFGKARELLEEIQSVHAKDQVIQKLIRRCREFEKDGLPKSWDGVMTMTAK